MTEVRTTVEVGGDYPTRRVTVVLTGPLLGPVKVEAGRSWFSYHDDVAVGDVITASSWPRVSIRDQHGQSRRRNLRQSAPGCLLVLRPGPQEVTVTHNGGDGQVTLQAARAIS